MREELNKYTYNIDIMNFKPTFLKHSRVVDVKRRILRGRPPENGRIYCRLMCCLELYRRLFIWTFELFLRKMYTSRTLLNVNNCFRECLVLNLN